MSKMIESFKQKAVGRGRPTDMVKLEDGTSMKLKEWVKTEDGKVWAKANMKVVVAAQVAAVEPVAPDAPVESVAPDAEKGA